MVKEMLSALRDYGINLPKTRAGLVKKNKSTVVVKRDMGEGQYCYYGIQNQLKRYEFPEIINKNSISCDFFVDGLPIFKKSVNSLWPIMGAISEERSIPPFVVAAYFGPGHPPSSNDFLTELANEITHLNQNGIFVGQADVSKQFNCRLFICDAPAKAFVKGVKGHNALKGCNECDQIGFSVEHTTVYRIESGNLRTNQTFRDRLDLGHHLSSSLTALEAAGIGMVTQFPLDAMHLIDLGIVKKILVFLLKELPKSAENQISNQLTQFGKCLPKEFGRKPRPLSEIVYWKATQFRFFILYAVHTLKPFISDEKYYHLLLLSVSIRLLSDTENCKSNIDVAQNIIDEFVTLYPRLYGLKHVNYNVHSLLHLPSYVKLYGPLQSFTAYKFENHMQELKRLIKNPHKILQQLENRLCEREYLNKQISEFKISSTDWFPGSVNSRAFIFDSFSFAANSRDCYCVVCEDNDLFYIKIERINMVEQKIYGQRYVITQDFFINPVRSSSMEIVLAHELPSPNEYFLFSQIKYKLCGLPFDRNQILLARMLHECKRNNYASF